MLLFDVELVMVHLLVCAGIRHIMCIHFVSEDFRHLLECLACAPLMLVS